MASVHRTGPKARTYHVTGNLTLPDKTRRAYEASTCAKIATGIATGLVKTGCDKA